jgi:hypothetical protein
MEGLRSEGAWLYEPRDMLIIKVKSGPTLVLLTSVRAEGMASLELAVERLDNRTSKASPAGPPALAARTPLKLSKPRGPQPASALARIASASGAPPKGLRTEITLHLSNRGDASYRDVLWAGALGESLPIEAFSITPMEGFSPDQIEYKGLAADGAETPWIRDGRACGSQGKGVPLVGFAVRLDPEIADRFDCEYRGAFSSGRIVGPAVNGAPCQTTLADDYLEGIQLTLSPREPAVETPDEVAAPMIARPIGPRFSVFREEVQ